VSTGISAATGAFETPSLPEVEEVSPTAIKAKQDGLAARRAFGSTILSPLGGAASQRLGVPTLLGTA
jgi:hypothetical protein